MGILKHHIEVGPAGTHYVMSWLEISFLGKKYPFWRKEVGIKGENYLSRVPKDSLLKEVGKRDGVSVNYISLEDAAGAIEVSINEDPPRSALTSHYTTTRGNVISHYCFKRCTVLIRKVLITELPNNLHTTDVLEAILEEAKSDLSSMELKL